MYGNMVLIIFTSMGAWGGVPMRYGLEAICTEFPNMWAICTEYFSPNNLIKWRSKFCIFLSTEKRSGVQVWVGTSRLFIEIWT